MKSRIARHPSPRQRFHAMVGWSFLHGHYGFGISLLLAFYGMLRTGEVTEVRNSNIFMKSASSPAVVSLGLTKSGKRAGAAESVTITADAALKWLWQWKSLAVPSARFVESVSAWRTLFKTAVAALEITLFEFRPYTPCVGGARPFGSQNTGRSISFSFPGVGKPLKPPEFILMKAWRR